MAQLLVNVVSVTLAPGGGVVIPHGLISEGVGVVPTQVIADRTTPIACSNATTTNVSFINPGAASATANFRCEYDHSIHATGATPIRYQGLDASISGLVTNFDALLFGPGTDGAVTLTAAGATPLPFATRVGATWTLTREVYATDFTVDAGVTVDTRGFGVWCTGTFTNNGTHGVYANSAVGVTGGAALNGSMGTTTAGPIGRSNFTGDGLTAGSAGAINTNALPGGNAGPRTGGSSTSVYTTVIAPYPVINTPWYIITRLVRNQTVVASNAGGGGACDVSGGGTAASGAGAGGLPLLVVAARNFDNSAGTIQMVGGNGGNATFTGAGIAGGGGASNGGVLYVVTANNLGLGTVQSIPGTGGLGANGGTNGANGVAAVPPTIIVTV